MLLCQERFLARLGSIAEGVAFIWKGGSLILRLYRTEGQPRYTIDVDFSVSGISTDSVQSAWAQLQGGLTVSEANHEPVLMMGNYMEKETYRIPDGHPTRQPSIQLDLRDCSNAFKSNRK
jgi:hypothetical protein